MKPWLSKYGLACALWSTSSCDGSATRPTPAPAPIVSSASVAPSAVPAGEIQLCTSRPGAEPAPASWSHDGHRVATARGNRIWIFDVTTGATKQIPNPDDVTHIRWSPDDSRLATVSVPTKSPLPNRFELWNTSTGALITKQDEGGGVAPTFTPDGAVVAFTGRLGAPATERYEDRPAVRLFDMRKEELSKPMTIDPPRDDGTPASWIWDHTGEPAPVGVVLNRSRSLAAIRWTLEYPISLWSIYDHRRITLPGSRATMTDMVMSHDEKWLAWGTMEGVGLWNLVTQRAAPRLAIRHAGRPVALAMHPRRAEIVVVTEQAHVCRWDLATGLLLWETNLGALVGWHEESARWLEESDGEVEYLPDEARVLVRLENSVFHIDAATGHIVLRAEEGGYIHIRSADMLRRATWYGDGIHAIDTLTARDTLVDPADRKDLSLDLSDDGKRLVAADPGNGEVVFFDLITGERRVLCSPRQR